MSFNNLAFNISKSSPTTSNPDTTSHPSIRNNYTNSPNSPASPASSSGFLPARLPPGVAPGLVVRDVAPTVVTYDDPVGQNSQKDTRKDLIELFDKFDVQDKKDVDKKEQVEDKFDAFKPNVPVIEKENDKNSVNNSDSETEGNSPEVCEKIAENSENTEGNKSNEVAEQTTGQTEPDIGDVVTGPEAPVTGLEDEIPHQAGEGDSSSVQPTVGPSTVISAEMPQTENSETNKSETDEVIDVIETTKSEVQPLLVDTVTNDTDAAPDTSDNKDIQFGISEDGPVEQYELTQDEINQHQTRPTQTRKISQVAVDPAEQYQKSHKSFDFHIFLEHLKKKSAEPVVKYIKSFLISFNRQAVGFSLQQKAKVVKDFKIFMSEKFMLFEPFKSMDENDLENSREGLEKLIMNRIFNHCFPPEISKNPRLNQGLVAKDLEDDKLFAAQVEKFSWISGDHLEVNLEKLTSLKAKSSDENLNFMDFAIKEFTKINDYRAPRDKIICTLNGCKIIFGFLKVNKQETNADAFIPILILIIIRAKIKNLISNIHYIENFRGLEWLNHGETSYYLSSILGAISFIENIDFESLSIDREEYDAHIEAWEASERIRKEQEATESIPIQKSTSVPESSALSPSSVLMTSAEMFTKSLSNFLSPSPQGSPQPEVPQQTRTSQEDPVDPELVEATLKQLQEIFPGLDASIVRDIVVMSRGDMDQSLDACLQILNDV